MDLAKPRDSTGVMERQKAAHQTHALSWSPRECIGWLCSLVGSAFPQVLLSQEESLSIHCLQTYSCPWEWIWALYDSVSTNTPHKMKHRSGHNHLLAVFFSLLVLFLVVCLFVWVLFVGFFYIYVVPKRLHNGHDFGISFSRSHEDRKLGCFACCCYSEKRNLTLTFDGCS